MTTEEIEQQIFEKMKAKDFGESMCNETKRNVLRWVMQQLHIHDVSNSAEYTRGYKDGWRDCCKDVKEFG